MNLFVWDFHGVMEKGNEKAVLTISNRALQELGYSERFTPEQNEALYGLKWFEYFAFLLPNVQGERHLALQQCCFKIQEEHPELVTSVIQPSDHLHDVLQQIQQRHEQILLSNTNPEALPLFLNAVGISSFFRGKAFAIDGHRGKKEKILVLQQFIQGKLFDKVIVISDSPSDQVLADVHPHGVFYLYAHPGREFRGDNEIKIRDLREVLI